MKPPRIHGANHCPVASDVISLVGDKWSVQVVSTLGSGMLRFSEIKRAVEGISQKMLTTTLRGLERDGYLTRTVYPTVPPRVDYELTQLGFELLEPVSALGQWAINNHARVLEARRDYDGRAD